MLLAIVSVVAIAMIAAPALVVGHDVLAKKKHHHHHHHHVVLKFTPHFYTIKGHHHCLKGTKGCTLNGK
jgi:hypothetical protein